MAEMTLLPVIGSTNEFCFSLISQLADERRIWRLNEQQIKETQKLPEYTNT